MPTIHISVPDRVYRELKEAADVYGIQVTDLIKVFIRNNIDSARRGKLTNTGAGQAEIEQMNSKVSSLENQLMNQ